MSGNSVVEGTCSVLLAASLLGSACGGESRVTFEQRREIFFLINSLASSDHKVFAQSCEALMAKGGRAVPFLIAELKANPNPRIRYQVARVLAGVRDGRGIDALFLAARLDPDSSVRSAAATSLDSLIELLNTPQPGDRVKKNYRLFSRRSIFSLLRNLKGSPDFSVRQRAAETLGEFGDERELDALFDAAGSDGVAAVRLEAVKAIVNIAYPVILSGEYRVTFFGTVTYGPDSFREETVGMLLKLLSEEADGSVRLESVKGLTRLVYPTFLIGEEGFGGLFSLRARSREVILRVRNRLLWLVKNDESSEVRKEAVKSLSKLFTALFDRGEERTNEEIRRSLLTEKRVYNFYPYIPGRIRSFRRRGFNYFPSRDEQLLKPVCEYLLDAYSSDPDAGVRREAVVGLSFLGEKSDSSTILRHLQQERSEKVWLASVEALGSLGGVSAAEALFNVYGRNANSAELRKGAVLSIGEIGDRGILRKLSGFVWREPNREVKLALLEALGYQKDGQTAAALLRATRDKDAEVRTAAVKAAGENFIDETVVVLRKLLKEDPDERVRSAACTSLSKVTGEDGGVFLIGALRDTSAAVRKSAAVELGLLEIGSSVEGLASVLLKDPDASVRAEAATSLGSIGGQKSVQPLISAICDDSSALVREQAMVALLKTDEPRTAIVAIFALLPKLAKENPYAYLELNEALPHLRQRAHGRSIGTT